MEKVAVEDQIEVALKPYALAPYKSFLEEANFIEGAESEFHGILLNPDIIST